MSGLEKFQDNPAWLKKLCCHLLSDRPPPKKLPEISQYRLQSIIDFPALIKAKKAELAAQAEKEKQEASKSAVKKLDKDKIFNAEKEKQEASKSAVKKLDKDKIFNAFEQNRERTASDKSGNLEVDPLSSLSNNVSYQDQLSNEKPIKSPDGTLLEDIEDPPRLVVNNTIFNGKESRISPVQRVRPSTILELNEADLSDWQSGESTKSFTTACTLRTYVDSSCYEIAQNNSLTGNAKAESTPSAVNVDILLYGPIAKAKPHGISKDEERLIGSHKTIINLTETQNQWNMDSVIIDLSSDDEEEPHGISKDEEPLIGSHKTIINLTETQNEWNMNSVIIDLSSDDEEESSKAASIDIIEVEESVIKANKENKPAQFNDTIEETKCMENDSLSYIAPTPKSVRNTRIFRNLKGNSNIYVNQNYEKSSPSTPINNALLHYNRDSRLCNHPFRRI